MLQHQFNFISNVTKQETHLHMGNYTKLFGGLNDNCYVVKQTKDTRAEIRLYHACKIWGCQIILFGVISLLEGSEYLE